MTVSFAQLQWNVTDSHLETCHLHMPRCVDVDASVIPCLTHNIIQLLRVGALLLYRSTVVYDYREMEPFASYCTLRMKMKELIWLKRRHTSIYIYLSKCPKRRKHSRNVTGIIFQHKIQFFLLPYTFIHEKWTLCILWTSQNFSLVKITCSWSHLSGSNKSSNKLALRY